MKLLCGLPCMRKQHHDHSRPFCGNTVMISATWPGLVMMLLAHAALCAHTFCQRHRSTLCLRKTDWTCNKHTAMSCFRPKGPDKAVLLAYHADSLCIHHAWRHTDIQDKGVREAVVVCSQGRGTRWTPLRSWMKPRRGRMLAMAFSSRPSMPAVTLACLRQASQTTIALHQPELQTFFCCSHYMHIE